MEASRTRMHACTRKAKTGGGNANTINEAGATNHVDQAGDVNSHSIVARTSTETGGGNANTINEAGDTDQADHAGGDVDPPHKLALSHIHNTRTHARA